MRGASELWLRGRARCTMVHIAGKPSRETLSLQKTVVTPAGQHASSEWIMDG